MSTVPIGPRGLTRARRRVERHGGTGLARGGAGRRLRSVLAPAAGRRLRAKAEDARTPEAVLRLAYDFHAFGIDIAPGQVPWELGRLLEELSARRPRRMLEIGTANGGGLFAFARMCAPDAHIISLDLPDAPSGGGYPAWRTPLYQAFAGPGQRLDLLRADSHDPATLKQVRKVLDGRKLEFLFIDGDHTYDGVRRDHEAYGPLLARGGLIGFHDIAPPRAAAATSGDRLRVGGVPDYWDHLRGQLPTRELVAPEGPGCFGIGLISVGDWD
jgi:predicted O-methyltransferase YrrM